MLLNLKPYIDVKNNGKAQSYTLGISTDKSYIDQKRDVIDVMPGYQIVVKVIPQVVGTSSLFAGMDQSSRNCKLSHEIANFNLIQHYTTTGCEFECAAKKAISQCKCLPWFYTSNFTNIPMCDTFSAYCFDHVMSDESNYKMCPEICRETCNDLPMTVAVTYLPIDEKEACGKGGLFHDRLMQATRQYYVFESYKALINGRIPDFKTGINNGSFCQDFVKRYVAQVSVGSSTSSVTKSLRSPRVTFIDQLGIIGGNLGLFTGMSILGMFEVALFLIKLLYNVFGGVRLKYFADKAIRVFLEKSDQTQSSKKVKAHPKKNHVCNKVLYKEIDILKKQKMDLRKSMLILMTLLPDDEKLKMQERINLKPTDATSTTTKIMASTDVESDGTERHHKKKKVKSNGSKSMISLYIM